MIEQGQVAIATGSMIKGSRPFYWILLKEANLCLPVFLSFFPIFVSKAMIFNFLFASITAQQSSPSSIFKAGRKCIKRHAGI